MFILICRWLEPEVDKNGLDQDVSWLGSSYMCSICICICMTNSYILRWHCRRTVISLRRWEESWSRIDLDKLMHQRSSRWSLRRSCLISGAGWIALGSCCSGVGCCLHIDTDIQQHLLSVKDVSDPFAFCGVYNLPSTCGKMYTGTMKRSRSETGLIEMKYVRFEMGH